GPIGGARVCYKDGEYLINPPMYEVADTDLDLIVAGTKEGVLMVESEAKELSEEIMLGAVQAGQKAYESVINGIIDLAEMCAKDMWDIPETPDHIAKLEADIKSKFEKDVAKAYAITDKKARYEAVGNVKKAA